MLVISRRKGQSIMIGDEIELVVTDLHRSVVKIGIRAPRGTIVLRGEVRDSIAQANQSAAESMLDSTDLDAALKPIHGTVDLHALTHPPEAQAGTSGATAPPGDTAVESGFQKLSRPGLFNK
jgi:carbon storage regulator